MKRKLTTLSQRYTVMLKKYLKQGARADSRPAHRLGRQAVAIGLETLDIARIHDGALAALGSPGRAGLSQRAALFFAEAIIPIEKLHRAAVRADSDVIQLSKALGRRTVDLADSRKSLQKTIIGRRTVEEALKTSGRHSGRLFEESRRLQKDLKHLTHRILKAHEDKRTKVSRDLRDEIAQTLLGINVRLLTLKAEASLNAKGLAADIATTQRLLDSSVRSIKRYARQFDKRHAP